MNDAFWNSLMKKIVLAYALPRHVNDNNREALLKEYADACSGFSENVYHRAWCILRANEFKVRGPNPAQTWPTTDQCVKACNIAASEMKPKAPCRDQRGPSDADIMASAGMKHALTRGHGFDFKLECIKEKRVLSVDEAKPFCDRMDRALAELKAGNFGKFQPEVDSFLRNAVETERKMVEGK